MAGITLKGKGGGFLIEIATRSGQDAFPSKARSTEPRRFGNYFGHHVIGFEAGKRVVDAKSFGQELRDRTKPLAGQQELGRKGRPGLHAWLRERVVRPNYIVFYRVLAEAHTVEILRVKHAAQRMP